MGEGFWVEISAREVPAGTQRPHGIDYSLCLFSPRDQRLLCFDNAHAVSSGRKPSRKTAKTNDHYHVEGKTKPYEYVDAETLLTDFWTEVDKVLKAKGVM